MPPTRKNRFIQIGSIGISDRTSADAPSDPIGGPLVRVTSVERVMSSAPANSIRRDEKPLRVRLAIALCNTLFCACRMHLDQALQLPNVADVVAIGKRRGQRCLLHVVVDAGLRRSDVTVVVAYDRCRTSVLQASNGFYQLDLQNTKHDPSPRLSSL